MIYSRIKDGFQFKNQTTFDQLDIIESRMKCNLKGIIWIFEEYLAWRVYE
jgi:hypothetical protein